MPQGRPLFDPARGRSHRTRSPLRVLVADDDRDTVVTLTTLLAQEGHETRGVESGSDVEALVRVFNPDAVLLDIGMPGKNGYEIARSLRQELGVAVPLLIAVTSYGRAADKLLAQIAGFHHHISKPYEMQEIVSILAALIVSPRCR